MNLLVKNWLKNNTCSLKGKKVVITGATGGLGKELCFYLSFLGAELVLVNRSVAKAQRLKEEIISKCANAKVNLLYADFENINDIEKVCCDLESMNIDVIIHNAGAYAIERRICESGYLNVFQINFISAAYMTIRLLPILEKVNGRVVVVGSIAHNYSKTNQEDIDFKTKTSAELCYGNSKRYLMFFHEQLLKCSRVNLAVTHPGITFTSITDHYPDWLFKIIKYPMKVIFMKPKKAALCILKGVFANTKEDEWFSPWLFGIWGSPLARKIGTAKAKEKENIYNNSLNIIKTLIKNCNSKV